MYKKYCLTVSVLKHINKSIGSTDCCFKTNQSVRGIKSCFKLEYILFYWEYWYFSKMNQSTGSTLKACIRLWSSWQSNIPQWCLFHPYMSKLNMFDFHLFVCILFSDIKGLLFVEKNTKGGLGKNIISSSSHGKACCVKKNWR